MCCTAAHDPFAASGSVETNYGQAAFPPSTAAPAPQPAQAPAAAVGKSAFETMFATSAMGAFGKG